MQEARLEDLRTIWDLPLQLSWIVMSRCTGPNWIIKTEEEKEQTWGELEKLWRPSQDG